MGKIYFQEQKLLSVLDMKTSYLGKYYYSEDRPTFIRVDMYQEDVFVKTLTLDQLQRSYKIVSE